MNSISNIKVNYMLIEQILRVTGTYKNLCDEYEFLDVIFKQARTGEIDSLFRDDNARNTAFGIIEDKLGVSEKYLSGKERIELGIYCIDETLIYDDESFDNVDLSRDAKIMNNDRYEMYYHEILKNPLQLDHDEIYERVFPFHEGHSEDETDNAIDTIEGLYSLRGLLTVILLNMADEIELIDKANVYKAKKWEPYINELEEPTEHGITYIPKFIEIRRGIIQTIIRNIFDLGYVFTFRDLEKESIMKI